MGFSYSIEAWLIIGGVMSIGLLSMFHLIASALKYETDLVRLRVESHRLREEFLRRKSEQEVVAVVDPVSDSLPISSQMAPDSPPLQRAA